MNAQPLRKKLLATAEHNRVNKQAIFVNQIVLGQAMNQHAAAIDDDVLAGLCFQKEDSRRAVFDQRRPARPSQLFGGMERLRRQCHTRRLLSRLWNWQMGQLPPHAWLHEGLEGREAISLPCLNRLRGLQYTQKYNFCRK